ERFPPSFPRLHQLLPGQVPGNHHDSISNRKRSLPMPMISPSVTTTGWLTSTPLSIVPLRLCRSSSHHWPFRMVTTACSPLAKLSSMRIELVGERPRLVIGSSG